MADKKLKPLSNEEHSHLWAVVENEGFGYYMMDYGPDLNAIERLGFDKEKVRSAIKLFKEIESKIDEGEELSEE